MKDEYEMHTAWKVTHHLEDRAICRNHTSTQGLERCELLYKEGILTPSSISIVQTVHPFSDIQTSQSSYISKPSIILVPQSLILQHHTRVNNHAFHHHYHRRLWLRAFSRRCPSAHPGLWTPPPQLTPQPYRIAATPSLQTPT